MTNLLETACRIRALSIRMVHTANASHIASSLSAVDLLTVLYNGAMQIDPEHPDWPDRDRLIVSKGHGAAAVYAALAVRGFFPESQLDTYCQDGSLLLGHVSHTVPGVEFSTGSLGHGLPVGCGLALAAKRDNLPYRVFVLLSDGELDEGSNWEAILFAAQHGLDNLIAIVDFNNIQGYGNTRDILNLTPIAAKWEAFNWNAVEINGHDLNAISNTLSSLPITKQRPSVVIAHTVKGRGVSYMENQLAWHYKCPNAEQLAQAYDELGVEF